MAKYRDRLPQSGEALFLTDGGLETTLIFHRGLDLPEFAAFPLLDSEHGRGELERYFRPYAELARERGVGIVLESATWRASLDWGAALGYSAADLERLNRAAVGQLVQIRSEYETETAPIVISGNIGPRGDGYTPQVLMTVEEAQAYHAFQVDVFEDTEADLVTAITMTHVEEAVGVVLAAGVAGMPVVISFTVETDGRLPSGQPLGEAIHAVDDATGSAPAYYMINCAHPSHFDHALAAGATWLDRIHGLRANASTLSHAELDEATELDAGDPADLARRYAELRSTLTHLHVLGGCCGTDHRHVEAMLVACAGAEPDRSTPPKV